jgi:hypothetical protein
MINIVIAFGPAALQCHAESAAASAATETATIDNAFNPVAFDFDAVFIGSSRNVT